MVAAMQKIELIRSQVIPLPMKDVDTDLIIPAQFLTSISRDGYGQNLFRRLRDSDPKFPFNDERYKGAQILVADSNFGCGSSREHAVWALQGAGIKAVLSKSFADIFYNNSLKNGLLAVELEEALIDRILAEATAEPFHVSVDLSSQQVELPDGTRAKFQFDPFRKHCLLNGLDDIDYILSHEAKLNDFNSQRTQETHFSTLALARKS
jgi:3-isopropylmalate/(R)-2-methylmalate dehydratase small subunit